MDGKIPNITKRGTDSLDANKAKGKGGSIPTITADNRSSKSASNTGVTELSNSKSREKGSGDPMSDSGLDKRGYSDQPRNPGRGRRIHDGVSTGPGIIHKDS